MNEKYPLYISLAAIIISIIAIGMSLYKSPGPQGPPGPRGPPGQQGPPGTSLIVPGEGLIIKILNVEIGSDLRPIVTFNMSDADGVPLAPENLMNIRFLIAAEESRQVDEATTLRWLRNYFTHTVEGEPYNVDGRTVQPNIQSASQPDFGLTGAFEELEPGVYNFTFGEALPQDYDPTATHVVGVFAERNPLNQGGEFVANAVYAFVPDGSEPKLSLMTSTTETCNRCHDPLEAHGGSVQEYLLCLMCHTPDVIDPETGHSVDFRVIAMKIHMGAELPSVKEGRPYYIVGYLQSVENYTLVKFPQDIRNCRTCHDGPDADNYLIEPSRAACGSCHDDVDFVTGEGHGPGLEEPSDVGCALCHGATMSHEFDLSIPGAHVIPEESSQLRGVNFDIISVSDTGPGDSPKVVYTVTQDDGEVIPPSEMDYLTLTLAGPTTAYVDLWTESDVTEKSVDLGNGTYSYTFPVSIPSDATGTYAVAIEGYKNQNITYSDGSVLSVRQTGYNDVVYIPVTDPTPVPSATVVTRDSCNSCHKDLALHGTIRKNIAYCEMCHNSRATDEEVRPEAEMPPQTVDFKYMVHRIHRGGEPPYVVYGFNGSLHDYSELEYSGNLRNCSACHVDGTFELPLPEGALPTTIEQGGAVVRLIPPITSVCTSCHISEYSASHAETMTAPGGVESCVACHGAGKAYSVSTTHGGIVRAFIYLGGVDGDLP